MPTGWRSRRGSRGRRRPRRRGADGRRRTPGRSRRSPRPRPARRARGRVFPTRATAASANATAECPDTYPSPVARSRTRTRASTSTGRARAATCFTALAPQYAPWLAISADAVRRGRRVMPAVAPTTSSDPTKLPSCTGAHTTGHSGSGRPFSAAKTRASTSGTSSVAVTTAQLPASNTVPPIAATAAPGLRTAASDR